MSLPKLESARMPSLRDKLLTQSNDTSALPAKKGRKKLVIKKKK